MPNGPKGQKSPADTIGGAVPVARITVSELENTPYEQPNELKAGHAGAREASMTQDERIAIARKVAFERWR